MSNKIGLLSLSRYGDVINSLPIAKHLSQMAPVDFIIAPEFAPILEGVSYVTAVPCPGLSHSQDTLSAMAWAQSHYPRLVNAQVFNNPNMSRTRLKCFLEEQYYLAGVHHLYGKQVPLFDRRNRDRESEWLKAFDTSKPIVVYNLTGQSTPMGCSDILERALKSRFEDTCTLVNLSAHRPPRIFDSLGLFDIAKVLISIDTSSTHLSRASSVPTIEFIREPGAWDTTPAGPNCLLYMGYQEVVARIEEILKEVESACSYERGTMYHVVNTYVSRNENDYRRMKMAESTWNVLYKKGVVPVHLPDGIFKRTSRDIGDSRQLPFIKDMLDMACERAASKDIIVITNNDTCITDTLIDDAEGIVRRYGCAYSHRYDFGLIAGPMRREDIIKGTWYPGMDIFVMTKAWWTKWRDTYPDMILGCEAWDYMMRETMKLSCGDDCQLQAVIYHEKHDSFWERGENRTSNPGQTWSRKLAYAWLAQHKSQKEANDNFPESAPTPQHRGVAIERQGVAVSATGLVKRIQSEERAAVLIRPVPLASQVIEEPRDAPVHVQKEASPIGRGQPIKAKVRQNDGSRVHLFR